MRKLTIIGASGHGRVVADIAVKSGYDEIEFLDDDSERKHCGKWGVIGGTLLAAQVDHDLFVAIGNAEARRTIMERLHGKNFPVLVHPNATVADDAVLGEGTVVMAGAVINPGAVIGCGGIVNTSASIDHDCVLGDYVHVAVGARLCGSVRVGNETWIGAGSTVINNTEICSGCMIGAGAVVIRSIPEEGVYVGVPAKMIRANRR